MQKVIFILSHIVNSVLLLFGHWKFHYHLAPMQRILERHLDVISLHAYMQETMEEVAW